MISLISRNGAFRSLATNGEKMARILGRRTAQAPTKKRKKVNEPQRPHGLQKYLATSKWLEIFFNLTDFIFMFRLLSD